LVGVARHHGARQDLARRALAAGCLLALALCAGAASGAPPRTLDAVIASCPTKREIAQFRRELSLTFEHDPSTARRCGMTLLRDRAYEALRVMRALTFTRPLPWTRRTLYDWLTHAVRGVRFRGDIDTSFCCSPARTIDVQAAYMDALSDPTYGWLDAHGGESLAALVAELVHEARHAQGKPHTCQAFDDATFSEAGAWGTEITYGLWLGLYAGSFVPLRYRDAALAGAQDDFAHICDLPRTSVAVALRGRSAVVRNDGGVALDHVWVATNVGVTRDVRKLAPQSSFVVALPRRATWARVAATTADPTPADNVAR
jgi:hypothetical protein